MSKPLVFVDIKGFDDLKNALAELPRNMAKNALRNGMRKVAKQAEKYVREGVSSAGINQVTGQLLRGIKGSDPDKFVKLGVSSAKFDQSGNISVGVKAPFYALFLERGWMHVGRAPRYSGAKYDPVTGKRNRRNRKRNDRKGNHIPARPFIEPAAERIAQEIPNILYPLLEEEIAKQLAKIRSS